jgi:PAS domain S-box-containing protein
MTTEAHGVVPNARIVLIEPEASARERLVRVLTEQHWIVDAVPGNQALAAIAEHRPDLVLIDVRTRDPDDFDLLRALRGDPETTELPVLLLSWRGDTRIRPCALAGGANGHVIEPFSAHELVARIQAQLVTAQLRGLDQQHREHLTSLLRNAPIPIAVMHGPDHVFELANDAYRKLVGGQPVLGRKARDAFPQLEGEPVSAILDRCVATREPYVGTEVPARFGRGQDGFLTFVIQPLPDTKSNVANIMVVVHDVTDQVLARRSVKAHAERLQLVLEASQLGDWDLDLVTRKARGSARHDAIYGYPQPVDWTYAKFLSHVAPEQRAEIDARLRAAIDSRSEWVFECRITRADGVTAWIESRGRFQLDEQGCPFRLLGTVADITSRKQTEEALARGRREVETALEQAKSANRAKDEFLAILGHELRNPLAPILTALHVMQLRGDVAAEKERAVIERQVNHLVRLVDDLLDVSRVTQGKVELKKARLELAEVVDKAIEMVSPLLEQREHAFETVVARTGLVVDADPTRLAQVFANLLTNAAKYTLPHGSITLVAGREGDDIVVRVRDTGIGITPEMLPRVFDLFAQETQALDRSRGGLGLGLTIVRNLVTLHGGTVSVHSDGEGRGTEFMVRLPAAEPAAAIAQRRATVEHEPTRSGKRVLIVDDNSDAAELLSDVLASFGCTTRVAHDGPDALRIAEEFHPEVALLDIGLPVMDGYELARRLREMPAARDAKLIAVTGYGQAKDRERSAEAGFAVHLVKPVRMAEVEAAIRRS